MFPTCADLCNNSLVSVMGIDAGVMQQQQTPTAVAGERVAERRTMASLETPVHSRVQVRSLTSSRLLSHNMLQHSRHCANKYLTVPIPNESCDLPNRLANTRIAELLKKAAERDFSTL